MEELRKIDIHAHAVFSELTPPHKATGMRFPLPEQLMEMYDRLGIEKGVLLPLVSPEAQWFSMTNENMKQIADQYPDRFVWFCNVDPRSGANSANTDLSYLLEYYKSLGAKGLGELTANLYADDPLMDNLFFHCAKCNMPVIIHISPAPGVGYGIVDDPGLPRIEKMLKKHPNLKLIGHSQPFWAEIGKYGPEEDRNGYPKGKVEEGALPRLLRECPNLYCDLSAGSGHNAFMRDPEYAVKFLTEFQDRVFYGEDICSVTNQHPYPFKKFIEELLADGKLSETVYRKVFRENAVKLLGLA